MLSGGSVGWIEERIAGAIAHREWRKLPPCCGLEIFFHLPFIRDAKIYVEGSVDVLIKRCRGILGRLIQGEVNGANGMRWRLEVSNLFRQPSAEAVVAHHTKRLGRVHRADDGLSRLNGVATFQTDARDLSVLMGDLRHVVSLDDLPAKRLEPLGEGRGELDGPPFHEGKAVPSGNARVERRSPCPGHSRGQCCETKA